MAVNSKEYLEMNTLNKKHKGIKKGSTGMGFESFTERIKSLVNYEAVEKPLCKYKEVCCAGWNDNKKTVVRSKFSQLNNKRFYFTDDFKKEKGQKIK